MEIENNPNEKKDYSTAILNAKKAPNKLLVEEAVNDDNSTVYMTAGKLEELGLFKGDPVLLVGKRRKTSIVVALQESGNGIDNGKIRMNKVVRKNLKLRLGDTVIVKPSTNTPNLSKIHILPFDDSVEGITGDLTQTYLIPYFKDAFRPIHKGDNFIVRGNFRAVEFKVVATEPSDFGIVNASTILFTEGEPIKRADEESANDIGYDDIGGCRRQMA
jgi:transitional endoplasmic reticulum ATPase